MPVSTSSFSLLLDGFSPCEQMLRVSQELQVGGAQSTALEVERLLSDVAAVTEERDQLKEDMKENVDMVCGRVFWGSPRRRLAFTNDTVTTDDRDSGGAQGGAGEQPRAEKEDQTPGSCSGSKGGEFPAGGASD